LPKKYLVTISWTYEVEAETEEDAKLKGLEKYEATEDDADITVKEI
jgi:hypothetical protein